MWGQVRNAKWNDGTWVVCVLYLANSPRVQFAIAALPRHSEACRVAKSPPQIKDAFPELKLAWLDPPY